MKKLSYSSFQDAPLAPVLPETLAEGLTASTSLRKDWNPSVWGYSFYRTFRRFVRSRLDALLYRWGLELVRCGAGGPVKSFLSFERIMNEAKKARLSVSDYIDATYVVPGATQTTVDRLAELGVIGPNIRSVCEIGPGTGRYLEKVLRLCATPSYQIYETDPRWAGWLVHNYHVKAQDADGKSLRQTATESIDLVHAHRVFVYLPFLVSCSYFAEMARVVRRGGWIVFDVITEICMDDATIERCNAHNVYLWCLMSRALVTEFLARRQCTLQGSFLAPMKRGRSEYLVFKKCYNSP